MAKIALEVKAISKRFGGVLALNQVEVSILENSRHVIIGPNGSGKSTLINVLSGVYTPEGGEVFFLGERITGLPSYRITAKGIARTFQNIRPFRGMSVGKTLPSVCTAVHITDCLKRSRTSGGNRWSGKRSTPR